MKKIAASFILSAALLAPGAVASAAPNQSELDAYLASIHLSQSQLEDYLESYGDSLDEYDSVAELKEVLGERLTEETLAALLDDYGMTEQEVIDLAVKYDDMDPSASLLDTYYFTSDIEYIIDLEDSELSFSDFINEYDEEIMGDMFEDLGVTSAEMNKFVSYVKAVFEKDPEAAAKMDVLYNNFVQYSVVDTTDLTASEAAELLNTIKEIEQTLRIDIKVFNEQGTVMKPLDFLGLETLDENYVLKVLDEKGHLLLDMILSDKNLLGDGVDGKEDPIGNLGDKIKDVTKGKHTENGGKLPNTASDTAGWALFGTLLAAAGIALRKKVK